MERNYYDYDEFSTNSVFIGAYDGNVCVGLAILQQAMFRYMYLYDLKVNANYRDKHIGTMLIEKAKAIFCFTLIYVRRTWYNADNWCGW